MKPDEEMGNKLALTVPQVAAMLQLGENKTYNLFHRADFPAIKFGSSLRVSRDALDRWLAAHAGASLDI